MSPFDVICAVIVVAGTGYALAGAARWARSNWALVRLGRWLTGAAHHGKPITDAGWFRPGLRALTPTGHATRWWHRPRWQRAAHRTGGTFAVITALACYLANPQITTIVLAILVAAGGTGGGWLAWSRLRGRKLRRVYVIPLHQAAWQRAGIPRAARAESWIRIELDGVSQLALATKTDPGSKRELTAPRVRYAELRPGPGWTADAKDEEWLAAVAAKRLGIESAEASWRRAGPVPLLILRHSPPPPGHVTLAELVPEIPKLADGELLAGVGKNGELVKVSLATDSPHIAISAGTGGTKSNVAGWLLLQMLVRGSIGLVLDAKRRLSYPWLLKDMDRNLAQLPNIGYAWTTAQIHEGMVWLSAELDRRGDVAFAGMDTRGKVHANVGARLFALAEELNLATPRLKAYWSENRPPDGPVKSPAFTGLGDTAFAGRQVRKHLILVGQMLTAEVTGSRDSSVREQCGVKFLTRYGVKGWRVMAEDIPMPPPPSVLGRFQVVAAGKVREVQTPELDPELARELVLDGVVSPLPSTMPRSLVTGIPAGVDAASPPADVTVSGPVPVTAGPRLVGLAEAAALLAPHTTHGSLMMMRYRDRDGFPARRGKRGKEFLYDLDELADYDLARR